MNSREADTLPPPSNSFHEPLTDGTKTDPPLSPAVVEAIEAAVQRAVGAVAQQWGGAYVAANARTETIEEIALNAVRQSSEAIRACAEVTAELAAIVSAGVQREQTTQNALLALNENVRAIRGHFGLPEHESIAALAAREAE